MQRTLRLGRRRLVCRVTDGPRLGEVAWDGAEVASAGLRPHFQQDQREQVVVALLDARHMLIGVHLVSVGSLRSSIVHPREVFRPAVAMSAAAVILAHSHPSGDTTPSVEDHQITQRLAEAGRLLGIPLLDHLILGEGITYRSFREEGWMEIER